MKKIMAVIPCRYASSRFPGKPLALINGKPMVQWVYETVRGIEACSEVYIATDDQRIKEAVEQFGGKVIMTGECNCGTDRVFEAIKDKECDIVLNIQGDEPLIKREMICDLLRAFEDDSVQMATLKTEIRKESEIIESNVVKVVTDKNRDALYFSRAPIPCNRDQKEKTKYFKHIGIYGYTKTFLSEFVSLPESFLEKTEALEQLRALENNFKIRVMETKYETIGVDLPEQITIVEEEMRKAELI